MTDPRKDVIELEERFHDEWARSTPVEAIQVEASFEAPTAPENRHILQWLGDVRGLSLLDLGSGCGEAAVYFAKRGAHVTAVDLSSDMLDLVQRVAKAHGVSLATAQMSADELKFPDATFDVVYAANLLHHVDIPKCLDEIHRVLKPGGRVVSWDPIKHNPLIKVYRRLATSVRTPDEHPLVMRDLGLFRKRFSTVQYDAFWFTTLWLFLRFFLIERVSPSKERYWKKIITEADRLAPTYRRLEKIDRWVLRRLPFLRRYCWNIVICCTK